MQTTLRSPVQFSGIGLHSGKKCKIRVLPADPGHGIVFERVDCTSCRNLIPALWSYVCSTEMATTVGNSAGVRVSTIEHLMAAFVACGIRNALIKINGPEVPIMDGSSLQFVFRFLEAGRIEQASRSQFIRILRPVRVALGDSEASLEPCERAEMQFSILFKDPIGHQSGSILLENGTILSDLVASRTFCFKEDIDAIHKRGLGLGGSTGNTVVVSQGVPPGPALRYDDEFVRHKMLDAVGDLSLAGFPILGRFLGQRSGHSTTAALLRKLLTCTDNYSVEDAEGPIACRLPGSIVGMDDLRHLKCENYSD